jgi:predicted nucleic acid-binding protein
MISLDTNVLFPAMDEDQPLHGKAVAFMASIADRDDVVISEFILLEIYNLLRNPAVMKPPLSAAAAVEVCQSFRRHPRWQVVGFPPDSALFHDAFWPMLRDGNFTRRRAFDWRTALSLRRLGVTDFATVNLKDFEGFGFRRVWNPLAD